MQCPLCAKEVDDLTEGLCTQCASERKPFLTVPDVVDVVRCAHCGRLQRTGGWVVVPQDAEEVVAIALPHEIDVDPALDAPDLKTQMRWEDPRNGVASVQLQGNFRGHNVERAGQARIRLKTTACHDCSREYGGYFEAIIQVRAAEDRVLEVEGDRVMDRIQKALDSYREEQRTGAWSSKNEKVRGGWDLYMGSQEVARLVARQTAEKYGAEYAESSKLVGRRDGNDLMRFTLLIRLPPYLPGDFILLDGRPFKVLRHDGKRLIVWDLERKERTVREPKRAKQLKVIGRAQDEKDAVVVSFHDKTLQILDPTSYKTLDVAVEDDFAGRETVRVFRYDETVFVVPDDASAR